MSTPLNLKLDPEKVKEMPMVDLAFLVLKAANTPYYYRDLMVEVAKLRGMTEEQTNDTIAQLYTEINIDGRFACVGTNLWGLKRWYPLERSDDPVGNSKRPRIINDEDDDLEDDDFTEEDDNYSAEEEDFDAIDEDRDDLYSDDDSEEEVDDDVVIDDDDIDEDEDEEDSEEDDNGDADGAEDDDY
ncbi:MULTISPECIES: DNA-directed RNA polymerase subunit delta [unclassified Paenibacillus]|uniref:DNA-directed RNA polymerase subunit delta n=1 Tax=unclassified Paenibacillus TaxID=185978 RepID=UPI0024055F92|nr:MULTISPECIES: DNA-directed RNA polymerase subunit delta [unclassified Paenibacillus]MDF9844901.1 DNA-directed RNA polymerase subunit delta [Paenibacillus sp. PastF-2]MDF9851500.1 DNA-directed RNA polymerase subunit delta [Paenibacillus sp. PastM-2]MDF9858084.1 DNA-directed RNA polymerase subunit delta [Paenibacillus sp. PastF-1]MDH6483329.1 DNA-directed RNA polymerase subunit delta [Paenibacillus sp. PastH-2]MDH6510738.1 DNA-directed RNA polymerase subunit delta [Paenibacillus sp. PastM-3]